MRDILLCTDKFASSLSQQSKIQVYLWEFQSTRIFVMPKVQFHHELNDDL